MDKRMRILLLIGLWMTVWHVPGLAENPTQKKYADTPRWTMNDVLYGDTQPFVIGHRGYGENLGEDPARPIENTLESVHRAFREGARIVEIDVVLTKDRRVVALHNDYLDDLSCVNNLDLAQLKKRVRPLSTLRRILHAARSFTVKKYDEIPIGQVIIEIKTPSPMCDPGDETGPTLVGAVADDIKHTQMVDQVMIVSFSPQLLSISAIQVPSVPRSLAISILQLLSQEEVEAITGLPVTLIDKQVGFGLQWAEIGPFFRLPSYPSVSNYFGTLVQGDLRAASIDKQILMEMEQQATGAGLLFVNQLRDIDIASLIFTINTTMQWSFMTSLGVTGIYTDDIPLGLSLSLQ
jgi:glycerophosphoryl diester phosphodiesterase